jgi:ubiquinone/menaquinone biosynthesis C-methylase UbiE
LPFEDKSFSAALAVLVLHHLKSQELQERAFAEIFRVLRPRGIFLAVEIQDGWLNRIAHIRSTFVPVVPSSVSERLTPVGFSSVSIAYKGSAYRLRALRP